MISFPKITVVTVVFNGVEHIEMTIQSIINQTYKNLEFIIIDGESTDGTLKVTERYNDRISFLISEPDNGVYDAMNKSLNIANGDFLIFMNAGDSFATNYSVENFVYSVDDLYSIYYGDTLFCDQKLKRVFSRGGKYNKFKIIFRNICHQSTFYPRHIYKSERYKQNYRIFADWEYNMRLMAKNVKFKHLPDVISVYQIGGLSSTRDYEFEKDMGTIIKDNFGLFLFYFYMLKKNIRIRLWYKKVLKQFKKTDDTNASQ